MSIVTPEVDRHAWAADVAAVLASLPTRQADALRLLYFEHLSDHEVATRMGVVLHDARAAAADGLRHLAEALLNPATPAAM